MSSGGRLVVGRWSIVRFVHSRREVDSGPNGVGDCFDDKLALFEIVDRGGKCQ